MAAQCPESMHESGKVILCDNLPHILNVPAAAFQNANRYGGNGQQHHVRDIEALFEIVNERAAGP